MAVLSVDAGTTGVTAMIVAEDGGVLARDTQEFTQHFPDNGWVEHSPDDIWQATLRAVGAVTQACEAPLSCVGITNQRETVVFWDRETLGAPRRAIVWQDRRTAARCDSLRDAGHEPRVHRLTGLRLDPYFSASKVEWVREHDAQTWHGVESGRVALGTVDSYLVARMTRGLQHLTDATNASRTLLLDLAAGTWSAEMCDLWGVPLAALPEVVPSYGRLAVTEPECFLGLALPITGIAGDQQAALFGQTAFAPGQSKCTYGTGSFVLTNTGATVPLSDAGTGDGADTDSGLLATVAWRSPDGTDTYALEGSVFVTGSAVQWLRDGLGVITSASEVEALARSVPDSGGVVFVPALAGLGAPHWDPFARGLVIGITRGTTSAHLARATLDGIVQSVRDVVDAMAVAAGVPLRSLAVDGGAAANDLLCQLQADQLQVPVLRPTVVETTGLGAAFLAGLGAGVWSSTAELEQTWQLDRRFEPGTRDDAARRQWTRAVERARDWARDDEIG